MKTPMIGKMSFILIGQNCLIYEETYRELLSVNKSKRGCSKMQPPKKRKSLGAVAENLQKTVAKAFSFW